jgi:hypothetical protein
LNELPENNRQILIFHEPLYLLFIIVSLIEKYAV